MTWLPLARFRDGAVPKLNNLRRATAARLRVPPTAWLPAAALAFGDPPAPPADVGAGPLIVRSAAPAEDGRVTSHAGQFLSLIVAERPAFAESVRRVAAALPRDGGGKPAGAVFVQPVVVAAEAGVAFFDGFYYERTTAPGGNQALTAGAERGAVERGGLKRADAWSDWMARVYAVFGEEAGGDRRIDVEFARDAAGYVLLQVRPALFPVRRNHVLARANVVETFGDSPSPWTTSSVVDAGRDMTFLTRLEPAVGRWEEEIITEVADRPWGNMSLWFRWMDVLGMPRSFLAAIMGGVEFSAADRRVLPRRLARMLPPYLLKLRRLAPQVFGAGRALRRIDIRIAAARGLADLYAVSVESWVLGIETAASIAGVLNLLSIVRRALRLPGGPRVVTQTMMDEYRRLVRLPDAAARAAGLDAWLARHGHRGPGESDLARPRFAELRDELLHDLEGAAAAPPPAPAARPLWRRLVDGLFRPL
jgi:hypothetical protein